MDFHPSGPQVAFDHFLPGRDGDGTACQTFAEAASLGIGNAVRRNIARSTIGPAETAIMMRTIAAAATMSIPCISIFGRPFGRRRHRRAYRSPSAKSRYAHPTAQPV